MFFLYRNGFSDDNNYRLIRLYLSFRLCFNIYRHEITHSVIINESKHFAYCSTQNNLFYIKACYSMYKFRIHICAVNESKRKIFTMSAKPILYYLPYSPPVRSVLFVAKVLDIDLELR